MLVAPEPANETERLAALRGFEVLDTDAEAAFDDITTIASHICGTSIALVSLVDSDRQWFKSRVGIDAEQTPRDIAFCSHAILEPDSVFVVPDAALDVRFADNPLVVDAPSIRFYAGAPLVTSDGFALGTLCAIDRSPKTLSATQSAALACLARQVVAQLELRRELARKDRIENELRMLSDSLARSNEQLDEFAYVASHDLKEPLRGIANYAQFLLEDYEDVLDEEGCRKLTTMTKLTRRLDGFIESLLYYSRLGRTELSMEQLDLDDVVDGIVETVAIRLREESVDLRRVGRLPILTCDKIRVGEIFRNLITNAMKYAGESERWIEIGSVAGDEAADLCRTANVPVTEKDAVVFYVRDNGIGIPEKHHGTIFKMFKRLHGRDEHGGGAGAGLAIVKKIVDRHGGQIWVDSEVGRGSTFYFTLSNGK